MVHDVIIVGGGPAGLSAALILGRCRRKVVLYDDDNARNARSRAVHGFLAHEGISPASLRKTARSDLAPYDVDLRPTRVVRAAAVDGGFEVSDAAGQRERARKLLLATGVADVLPSVAGVAELYGRGIYPCVYCDGWELRDRALGSYGSGAACVEAALGLTTWSRDVILFTDGGEAPSDDERARLGRNGVSVREESIVAFEGDDGGLRNVVVDGGARIGRDAIFLHLGQRPRSVLAEMLGCEVENAAVDTLDKQRTSVPGLYIAGDASHDVKFAIVAAAHGARAAHDINQALREEDTR